MANGTSSIGNNLDSCSSNPHLPTNTTSADEATMRDQRLTSVTESSATSNFTDRLLTGGTDSYNFRGSMQATIDGFTSQFGNTTTTNGSTSGTSHSK